MQRKEDQVKKKKDQSYATQVKECEKQSEVKESGKIDTWAFTGSLDQSKTWNRMSELQSCEKVNFYCFNHSKFVLIFYGDPSNRIHIINFKMCITSP